MPIQLRVMLIIGAVGTMIYFIGEIRKNQLQIKHALFWTVASLVLVIMSLLPTKVYEVIHYVGLQSPTNFVFLLLIFALIIRQFSDTVKISVLERKLSIMTQRIALMKMDEEKRYGTAKSSSETQSEGNVLKGKSEREPGATSKEKPKEIPEGTAQEKPEEAPGETAQEKPKGAPEETAQGKLEEAPGETAQGKPEETRGEISQEKNGSKPEGENAG